MAGTRVAWVLAAVYIGGMNPMHLLAWPATIAWIAALVFALLALLTAGRAVHHWRDYRRGRACWHGLWFVIFSLVTVLLAGGGVALRGYRVLTRETPVASLHAHKLAPQRWQVTLDVPDAKSRTLLVDGDAFRLDALVVKWKLPALLAGAPPVYRLDRLSGRYASVAQAMEAPRTIVALSSPGRLDLWTLEQRFPRWLPAVDAAWGSGAWLPLVDGGNYRVSVAAAGGLVARPADAATAGALRGRR